MKHLRYSLEIISHPQKELIQLQKHLGQARDLFELQNRIGPNEKIKKTEKQEKIKARKIVLPALLSSLKQLNY